MIDKIAAILDRRAMMLYPWENQNSEHYGKDYVPGFCSRKAIAKRRRIARSKAVKIMELIDEQGDG